MPDSPFVFADTASARQGTTDLARKLEHETVAIVGVGGTGAYVLDLVAKTWVKQIILFDGDAFLNHNAFRAPGAYSEEELAHASEKASFHARRYSRMRRGISVVPEPLGESNIHILYRCDTVFVCVDGGSMKASILETCLPNGSLVIDCGMGVKRAEIDRTLMATIRVTTCLRGHSDHVRHCIDMTGDDGADEYQRNAQMAELNALNAAMAVIKWKKLRGIYRDAKHELNSEYVLDWNSMIDSYETA